MADRLTRATRLLIQHFIPFMTKCLLTTFPYEQCYRPYFTGRGSIEKYRTAYSLLSPELLDLCQEEAFFHAIWLACEADSTAAAADRGPDEEGEVPMEVPAMDDKEEPSTDHHTPPTAPLMVVTTDATTNSPQIYSPARSDGTEEKEVSEQRDGSDNLAVKLEGEKGPDLVSL